MNEPDPATVTNVPTEVTFTFPPSRPPYAEAVDDGDPDGTLTAAEIYERNTEGV